MTMKILTLLFVSLILNFSAYCQSDDKIIFKYAGEQITIRKQNENNVMWYSEKNDKILTYKEEFSIYPDSTYYLIKPTITIFATQLFKTDTKEQINIRIDYFYNKGNDGTKKIESWSKSYYPSIQKVESMQDTRNVNNKVSYVMADKSQWIIEDGKNGEQTIFYVANKELSYSDYALMLPNCKTVKINGGR